MNIPKHKFTIALNLLRRIDEPYTIQVKGVGKVENPEARMCFIKGFQEPAFQALCIGYDRYIGHF